MERAVRIHKYGPPEVLTIESIDVSPPGPREAMIRHTAIGLNFVEVYFRRGTFQAPALPAVLGNEGAGVVEAVGPGVKDVSVGDRVVYADGPLGAYATARIYPADRLVRIPDGVSDIQAAASFLRGVTARMLLKEVAPLQRDDVVLFHAAAGGVGLLFAQWARALGVRVIGTVSNEAKAAAARQAGCIEVIDYVKEDFLARVRDLTGGEGVAAVFELHRPGHVHEIAGGATAARRAGPVWPGVRQSACVRPVSPGPEGVARHLAGAAHIHSEPTAARDERRRFV